MKEKVPTGQEQEKENTITKEEENAEPVDVTPTDQYISAYTGLELSKESFDNIPFLVIVENSKAARPQSGLSEADIVYETMAEGGIPRFMALFHSNPKKLDLLEVPVLIFIHSKRIRPSFLLIVVPVP